jgi:hypothetical protein
MTQLAQELHSQVKVNVMIQLMVSQPDCLGGRNPFGTPQSIFLLLLIIFRQLWVCWYGCPLWRQVGSVVCSCCWASSAQSFLGPSPSRTHDHIVSNLRFSQSGAPGSCIHFPQEHVRPLIPLTHWICLIHLHVITLYIYTYTRPLSVQARYSRLFPTLVAQATMAF